MTRTVDLLTALLMPLAAIRLADGYATDAGAEVLLGPQPLPPAARGPLLRVHAVGTDYEVIAPRRPMAVARLNFVVEGIAECADAAQMVAQGEALIADIERAIYGSDCRDLSGHVMEITPVSSAVLPPEEGSRLLVVQVRGSIKFHKSFKP